MCEAFAFQRRRGVVPDPPVHVGLAQSATDGRGGVDAKGGKCGVAAKCQLAVHTVESGAGETGSDVTVLELLTGTSEKAPGVVSAIDAVDFWHTDLWPGDTGVVGWDVAGENRAGGRKEDGSHS